VPGKASGGEAGERPQGMGRAVEHGNRNRQKDLVPPLPPAQLNEVVGTHQPDETPSWKAAAQRLQAVGGVMRTAEPTLEIADDDASVSGGDPPSLLQSEGERRHAGDRLQRVLRRHQPPYLVQREAPEREQAQMQMAVMGRLAARCGDAGRRFAGPGQRRSGTHLAAAAH
jgi:hypothetical protein